MIKSSLFSYSESAIPFAGTNSKTKANLESNKHNNDSKDLFSRSKNYSSSKIVSHSSKDVRNSNLDSVKCFNGVKSIHTVSNDSLLRRQPEIMWNQTWWGKKEQPTSSAKENIGINQAATYEDAEFTASLIHSPQSGRGKYTQFSFKVLSDVSLKQAASVYNPKTSANDRKSREVKEDRLIVSKQDFHTVSEMISGSGSGRKESGYCDIASIIYKTQKTTASEVRNGNMNDNMKNHRILKSKKCPKEWLKDRNLVISPLTIDIKTCKKTNLKNNHTVGMDQNASQRTFKEKSPPMCSKKTKCYRKKTNLTLNSAVHHKNCAEIKSQKRIFVNPKVKDTSNGLSDFGSGKNISTKLCSCNHCTACKCAISCKHTLKKEKPGGIKSGHKSEKSKSASKNKKHTPSCCPKGVKNCIEISCRACRMEKGIQCNIFPDSENFGIDKINEHYDSYIRRNSSPNYNGTNHSFSPIYAKNYIRDCTFPVHSPKVECVLDKSHKGNYVCPKYNCMDDKSIHYNYIVKTEETKGLNQICIVKKDVSLVKDVEIKPINKAFECTQLGEYNSNTTGGPNSLSVIIEKESISEKNNRKKYIPVDKHENGNIAQIDKNVSKQVLTKFYAGSTMSKILYAEQSTFDEEELVTNNVQRKYMKKKELKPLVNFVIPDQNAMNNTKEKLAKFNLGNDMTYTLYGTPDLADKRVSLNNNINTSQKTTAPAGFYSTSFENQRKYNTAKNYDEFDKSKITNTHEIYANIAKQITGSYTGAMSCTENDSDVYLTSCKQEKPHGFHKEENSGNLFTNKNTMEKIKKRADVIVNGENQSILSNENQNKTNQQNHDQFVAYNNGYCPPVLVYWPVNCHNRVNDQTLPMFPNNDELRNNILSTNNKLTNNAPTESKKVNDHSSLPAPPGYTYLPFNLYPLTNSNDSTNIPKANNCSKEQIEQNMKIDINALTKDKMVSNTGESLTTKEQAKKFGAEFPAGKEMAYILGCKSSATDKITRHESVGAINQEPNGSGYDKILKGSDTTSTEITAGACSTAKEGIVVQNSITIARKPLGIVPGLMTDEEQKVSHT